jgi:hypothetical protein
MIFIEIIFMLQQTGRKIIKKCSKILGLLLRNNKFWTDHLLDAAQNFNFATK